MSLCRLFGHQQYENDVDGAAVCGTEINSVLQGHEAPGRLSAFIDAAMGDGDTFADRRAAQLLSSQQCAINGFAAEV